MELSDVGIGTKLELELYDNSGERLEPTLVSEFEWLETESVAVIAAPIFEGKVVPLQINSVMNIYFIKKDGGLNNLYKFNAIILSRDVSENLHILTVEKQGDIVKVQRRNYFRLDCFAEVKYRVVGESEDEAEKESSYVRTLASNLSGGGISLMLEEKIEPGSILECEMFSDQMRMVKFYGRVVRFEDTGREGKYRYEAGIAYIEINDNDRETIVRYIFDEQRKLLKKGLI